MAAVETNDGMRVVDVFRADAGNGVEVTLVITSEKLIPGFQILVFSAEAWDELVAGAK